MEFYCIRGVRIYNSKIIRIKATSKNKNSITQDIAF